MSKDAIVCLLTLIFFLSRSYSNTKEYAHCDKSFFFFFFLMRRVQSLELNSNSYSSFSHQNNQKVSLPPINETNFAPKSSSGWLHRSAPNINARNTIVPIAITQENIPDYFGSTMQSMSLAVFTFAYTEVVTI